MNHKTSFNRLLCFACLTFYIICCGKNGFSQTEQSKRLTINDVTIARDKPTIYLCVDRELMKKKKEAKDDNLWVRVYNNTIWAIKFQAVRPGTPPQLFERPNGKFMTALTNESIAFPHYQFQSKVDAKEFNEPAWGDFGTIEFLPSNISSTFEVPAKYFKDGVLYLEYNYEWEFVGAIGHESHSPTHRVYLHLNDISNLSGEICY
jgi:hypothetical protein